MSPASSARTERDASARRKGQRRRKPRQRKRRHGQLAAATRQTTPTIRTTPAAAQKSPATQKRTPATATQKAKLNRSTPSTRQPPESLCRLRSSSLSSGLPSRDCCSSFATMHQQMQLLWDQSCWMTRRGRERSSAAWACMSLSTVTEQT